jgi:transketolase
MRDSFVKSITELAKSNSNVMLLTADLGFGVFEDFEKLFPKQFLNVGVAEQNMTGVAVGLSLEGKVVFTYSIGNFPILRCLEQIRNDACYHEVNVNIVASGGGFSYGALGMSHHTTEDLAIIRALPGMTVVSPGNAWEAGEATKALAKTNGVGYLRLDKTQYIDVEKHNKQFFIGKSQRVCNGDDITIIATGGIVSEAFNIAKILKISGIHSRVISMHTIKPIDKNEILKSINETGALFTLEEHNVIGGLGSAVAEVCLNEGCFPSKFKSFGLQDLLSSIVGSQQYLREYHKIDAKSVAEQILNLLDK